MARELSSGKTDDLKLGDLGQYSPNRQVRWSGNSKYIYSVLNKRTELGHQVFCVNVDTKIVKAWPVVKPTTQAYILASNKTATNIYLLLQEPLDSKRDLLGEATWRFKVVSLNILTGKTSTLFLQDRILGLSENAIVLKN